MKEIFLLFFRLGLFSFGGPALHIAMMESEFVKRQQWLSHKEFLELVGVSNMIPGPNSTELAIHLGYQRKGWIGFFTAGIAFILPASLLVMLLAYLYKEFGSLPSAMALFYGMKPVLLAILVQALWRLGKSTLNEAKAWFIACLALFLIFQQSISEPVILLLCGILALGFSWRSFSFFLCLIPSALEATTIRAPEPFFRTDLFVFFAKTSSVLFGSGYILYSYIYNELVEQKNWLSNAQLVDAIAAGQITPGPLFSSATFIGYLLDGVPGAIVATLGIFLPAFFFVALSIPLLKKMRGSEYFQTFLTGVVSGSLALLFWMLVPFSSDCIKDATTLAVFGAACVALFRFAANPTLLLLAGALFALVCIPT